MQIGYAPLTKRLLKRLNDEAEYHRAKDERPTVAIMIWHRDTDQFLGILGKRIGVDSGENPGLVKGGKQRRENILKAARRESREEIKTKAEQLEFKGFIGTYRIPSLRGPYRWKYYICLFGIYSGPLDIDFDRDELSGSQWFGRDGIEPFLRPLYFDRPEKYEALMQAFSNGLDFIDRYCATPSPS